MTAQNDANQAFTSISDAVGSMRTAVQEAAQTFTELISSLNSTSASAKGITSSFDGTEGTLNAVSNAAKSMGTSITEDERVVAALDSQTKTLVESLASVETTMSSVTLAVRNSATAMQESENAANGLRQVVNEGGLLIGLQMVGQSMEHIGELGADLFKDAISSAADFEGNISRIHAVLMNRDPSANMQQMADAALQMGQNSKFSANEIASGMYELARQGLNATDILGDGVNGAIQVTNDLAQATDTNMSDTARVVTDVMHEYGISGDHLRSVSDIISGAMHSSSESMTDFYQSMKQVGPVASSMHQSVDDFSTALAILAQHGITGSQAGTALKNMLLGLEPHTAKAKQLMDDLGISAQNGAANSFYQLDGTLKPLPDILDILNQKFGGLNDAQKEADLATTFTKYGLAGLNVVVGQSRDSFLAFQNELKKEDAASIAHEKMNNLQGDMWRVQAATETLSKSFGTTLQEPLRAVAQHTLNLINAINSLSPSTKEAIMVVGGVMSAMVAVGGAILTVVSSIGFLRLGLDGLKLNFASLLSTTGLVILGIAVLGIGLYELWKHWDEVKAKMEEIRTGVMTTIQATIQSVTNFINAHKSALEATATTLAVIFGPAIVKAGIEAGIAGAKLAAEFTVAVVKAGVEAVVTGAKLTASLISSVVQLGIETVATAGKITAQMIVALLSFAGEGWKAALSVVAVTANLVEQTAAFLASKVAMVASTVAQGAATVAQWALNAAIWAFPGTWIVAALIAVGVAIYELITHWSEIKTKVEEVTASIKSHITDMVNEAEQWGHNLIHMIAQGISNAIGEVESAVSNVAGSIKKFLGFHSPTEGGPASDSDTWAPNFVNMFASGLSAGANQVGQAAQTMIQPLSDVMNGLGGGGVPAVPGGFSQDQLAQQRDISTKIIQQKQAWEDASKHGDQAAMDSAHKLADDYRKQLTQMGGDASKFSENTTIQDSINNVQQICKQITGQISTDYSNMTTSMSDSLQTASSDTLKQNTIISDSFNQLNGTMKDVATSMSNTMTIAFDNIANAAERMVQQVIDAVNRAKAALASMPGSGVSMNASINQSMPSNVASFPSANNQAMIVLPNVSRGGDVHFHGDININGANKNGGQLASEIMQTLRTQTSFAL